VTFSKGEKENDGYEEDRLEEIKKGLN